MYIAIALIILLLIASVGIWLTFNLVGLLITLFFAGLIGWIADQIVPGELPYGWLGAVVAGLLGGWIGGWILGGFGPEIRGIAIIPALLGAILVAFAAELVMKATNGRRL